MSGGGGDPNLRKCKCSHRMEYCHVSLRLLLLKSHFEVSEHNMQNVAEGCSGKGMNWGQGSFVQGPSTLLDYIFTLVPIMYIDVMFPILDSLNWALLRAQVKVPVLIFKDGGYLKNSLLQYECTKSSQQGPFHVPVLAQTWLVLTHLWSHTFGILSPERFIWLHLCGTLEEHVSQIYSE